MSSAKVSRSSELPSITNPSTLVDSKNFICSSPKNTTPPGLMILNEMPVAPAATGMVNLLPTMAGSVVNWAPYSTPVGSAVISIAPSLEVSLEKLTFMVSSVSFEANPSWPDSNWMVLSGSFNSSSHEESPITNALKKTYLKKFDMVYVWFGCI